MYCILSCVRTPHELKVIELALGWGPVTTIHGFGSVLGRHFDNYFGLSQLHGHGFWLVCEVASRRVLEVHGSRAFSLVCEADLCLWHCHSFVCSKTVIISTLLNYVIGMLRVSFHAGHLPTDCFSNSVGSFVSTMIIPISVLPCGVSYTVQ